MNTALKAMALYRYRDNTFVLVECNRLFEQRQQKSIEEMIGKSLLDLFELPTALLLADVFYGTYSSSTHKEASFKHKAYYDVNRLDNGDVLISYR